jgi:hypothetical protein
MPSTKQIFTRVSAELLVESDIAETSRMSQQWRLSCISSCQLTRRTPRVERIPGISTDLCPVQHGTSQPETEIGQQSIRLTLAWDRPNLVT